MNNRAVLSKISWLILILAILVQMRCGNKSNESSKRFIENDTLALVQAVLNDEGLINEVVESFNDKPFKLIYYPTINHEYKLTFMNRPIQKVTLLEDTYQIPLKYPGELYVSIPKIKFINKDSASVELIFHAGNAIRIFDLKKVNESWKIVRLQKGKF